MRNRGAQLLLQPPFRLCKFDLRLVFGDVRHIRMSQGVESLQCVHAELDS